MEMRSLEGYTVGITAVRRWQDQAELLRARGADVLHSPVLQVAPVDPGDALRRMTVRVVERPPDLTILTTGAGTAGWLSAAESFGAGESLVAALRSGRILPRGPKTVAACVQAGLDVPRDARLERVHEVLEAARALMPLDGARVAVQLDGGGRQGWLLDALRGDGAEVLPVRVYRWGATSDAGRVARLIEAVCRHGVDAVTFTSTPAVDALFERAAALGRERELRVAFSEHTAAVSVGPVTSEALRAHGVTWCVEPRRARLGAMIWALAEHLSGQTDTLLLAGCLVRLQGSVVTVAGERCRLSDQERRVFHALAAARGRVLSKSELLRAAMLDGQVTEHAVEVAVARLRRRLGPAGSSVRTVFRRGYRLEAEAAENHSSMSPPVTRSS